MFDMPASPPAIQNRGSLLMNKEKQRKRALVVSIGGKEGRAWPGRTSLQPGDQPAPGMALREHQRRVDSEYEMEKNLSNDHAVLYAEFRKSREASPGVVKQFDQITRDMLAQAHSTKVVATLIRRDLGLPEA